jgi:two-component system, chemotaxis family, sensor kinase CheA
VAHALRARKRAERRASNLSPVEIRETVKVDTERIDELIELVGELVITQSILTVAPELRRLDSPRLRSALIRLSKIARDLQGLGMHMRMVPVRGLFQKMSRATRELSRKLGRDILLATDGADTEIDRSMVERLADPLLHMIRNAVDHGIESPDERRAAGKSLRGTIWLRARQEGASIVIQVTDDGRGLDVERILRKARERGLVGPDDRLSSGQVYKLIFTAGFSTADQVSDVSGRGVGMDVVRRHIESMRGRVHVSSELGQGTTFSITLPLTLAVIDGTLVRSGPERYIIPTLSILESIRPHQGKLHRPGNGAELIILGEQSLPIVRLSEILGCGEKPDDDRDGQLLIMESLGHRLALLVDDILGHQQVVIKNLGSYFQEKRFLAGAAILSDGNVGLILNVDELATLVDERTSRLRSASVAPL